MLGQVGHAGTLDPMATGLLIVCLGKATKLADRSVRESNLYLLLSCFDSRVLAVSKAKRLKLFERVIYFVV